MNKHPLLAHRFLCAVAAVVAGANASAGMPANPEAQKRAAYTCPKITEAAQKARIAGELRQKSHDKNALACAMDMHFELVKAAPMDLQTQLAALASLVEYIDHVRLLKLFELVQMNWAEYSLRLEHAEQIRAALVPLALKAYGTDPRVTILTSEARVLLAGPNDPEVRLAALEQLKKAIANDPTALHGDGQIAIARIYLDLPSLFGGGADKATPYLEEARKLAPHNPRVVRYLAEANDELGQEEEARNALRALAAIAPSNAQQRQMFADEWRMGEGLATRIGDPALAKQFGTLRNQLMDQHPELLRRNVETVFGHGGSNPVTGEPQYSGEGALHDANGHH